MAKTVATRQAKTRAAEIIEKSGNEIAKNRPLDLVAIADELKGLVCGCFDQGRFIDRVSDDAEALFDAGRGSGVFAIAERIAARPLPDGIASWAGRIRDLVDAPFDPDEALAAAEIIAKTFDGGRPGDLDVYVRMLFEVMADDRASPAVIHRARKLLFRTRSSGFRLIPKDLIDACAAARADLCYIAGNIDIAVRSRAQAVDLLSRRKQIEARRDRDNAEARERIARLPRPAERADGSNAGAAGQELLDAYRAAGVDP